MLKAKVDASDLVQQTLLDAHRGLAKFRGETEAEWLGCLARHRPSSVARQRSCRIPAGNQACDELAGGLG